MVRLLTYSFLLQVRVALPGSSNIAQISAQVLDVNDHSPVFKTSFYMDKVLCTVGSDVTITTLFAEDLDEGINSRLTYTIMEEENQRLFQIDSAGWYLLTQV